MKWLVPFGLACAALGAGCTSDEVGRPPTSHAIVDWEWFACDRCGSAEGGMYVRGAVQRDHTPEAATCVHRWRPTSKTDFRRRYTETGRTVPPYAR